MKIIIQNHKITIEQPDQETLSKVCIALSYTDKAIQYKIKKMQSNPYFKNSTVLADLKNKVHGKLYTTLANGDIELPSGFAYMFSDMPHEDLRVDTGDKVSYPFANKPWDMRPYQSESVDLLENSYRGIINLATGLGKSLIMTYIIRRIGKKTLIVVPSSNIANQLFEDLRKVYGENRVGIYGDGHKKIRDITVGIAASVNNNIELFKKENLGLVLADEMHHIAATTFYNIAEGLSSVGRMYGVTATAFRNDGKDIFISAGCGKILIERDVKWGVANGFLTPPVFMVRKVKTTAHDYQKDKLKAYKAHVLDNPTMKAAIEKDTKTFMDAKKNVLVLVDMVAHGKELSASLGIPFATSEDKDSWNYITLFNRGKINAMVATSGMVGEGVDIKCVDVLIMADFTVSKGAVLQAIGRALRLYPGKDKAIIIDYIPCGSTILKRHAMTRIGYFKEITDKVKVIE